MCVEKNVISKCRSCAQDFYYNDFKNHRQELSQQLEELEVTHDIFQQTTKETRQLLPKHTVTYIYPNVSFSPLHSFINITLYTQWKQNGITIVDGNGRGNRSNPPSFLQRIYVDDDQTINIDSVNDLIMDWKYHANNGQIVAGGNEEGNEPPRLIITADVIVDKETDCLIICDYGNRRGVSWSYPDGTIRLIIIFDRNYSSLTMDDNRYLYVSDTGKYEAEAIENRRFECDS